MSSTDLDTLLDMGFEKPRVELAIKRPGGLHGAIQWLEDNQDKTIEEIMTDQQTQESEGNTNVATLQDQVAKSITCNQCGKKFRNQELAEYHATKTDHTEFSESVEEIAPLTEEEKKARLQELREKLAEKKAGKAVQEQEDAKRNEQIRLKSTKESQDIKDELQRKEQIKEAARKRQEKLDDIEAKRRIKAKIEADKEERRRKAEEAKALREGRGDPVSTPAIAEPIAETKPKPKPSGPAAPKVHTEARLRLQTKTGNLMKTLPAETTLSQVADILEQETGMAVTKFSTTFPKKVFAGTEDFTKTLQEAGMVPSSAVIVD